MLTKNVAANEKKKQDDKTANKSDSENKTALKRGSIQESTAQRIVHINQVQSTKFCTNKISTAKYDFVTFLPKFFLEQFRKYTNVFFLALAILQQIPNVSPTGRYTTAVPLFIILTISAIKEIIEDYKRHKADDLTNNSKILVLRNHEWVEICWKQLQVGDFVKLINGQGIPADLVLLSSSEPHGMSYIETSNLDGETNLKMRQGIPSTSDMTVEDLGKMTGIVTCQTPNLHLYEFCGNISLDDQVKHPLSNDQLLLRGATLKNTKWIFGLVVYSGHDTKVMLNSMDSSLKRSSVERMTNHYILVLCGLIAVLTLTASTANFLWTKANKETAWYLEIQRESQNNFGLMLLTAFILFHTMIPISLPVALEIVRFIQAYFINVDLEMYDTQSESFAKARTSNLNEELGQVKYIFSDKTGTLTRNIMEFKQCSIQGAVYGQAGDSGESVLLDENLLHKIDIGDPDVDMFFKALAVCHTVVPERDENEDIIYQASSPDESALVKAAKELGYVFDTRTPDGVKVMVRGKMLEYRVLNVLEFTSLRKRMSVIVRTPDSRIVLFTKGADNVIYERLSSSSRNGKVTLDHLEEFAKIGLRTLCIAYADIDHDEYEKWKELFHQASVAIDNREDKLAKAAELIEKNLVLIGASAIEDKLQDQVPETIANLAEAGIKIWVLTGDKQETAINIGYSCQLLTQTMTLCVLDSDSLDKTRTELNLVMQKMGDALGKDNDIGLIINGETLKYALNAECRDDFVRVALSSRAVICCRVSPSQKAEVVTLVKLNIKDAITLAIGDGANDVGMIQAAHVGIGISGLEGQQAACNSDYAIGQFRFLNRLLLVHGAWNYSRLTKLILYSLYKNICFFITQFWFSAVSGFSGQILFERWSITLYNILFTFAPPLALGILDRCWSAQTCLEFPQLYKSLQDRSTFSVKVFCKWVCNAFYHSLVIFGLTVYANSHDVPFQNGQTGSLLLLGNYVYAYIVVTVSLKAALEHRALTWLSQLVIWGSIALWFIYIVVHSYTYQLVGVSASMTHMYQAVFGSGIFWLGLVLIPVTALTRDIAWKAISRTLADSLRERALYRPAHSQRLDKPTNQKELKTATNRLGRIFRMRRHKPDDISHPGVINSSTDRE